VKSSGSLPCPEDDEQIFSSGHPIGSKLQLCYFLKFLRVFEERAKNKFKEKLWEKREDSDPDPID